jgi:hypothetical protein
MSTPLKVTGYIILGLCALLIAGLVSASYSVGLYLLLGVAVAWLITLAVPRIPKWGKWAISRIPRSGRWLGIVAILIAFLLCAVLCVFSLSPLYLSSGATVNSLCPSCLSTPLCRPSETITSLAEYHATVSAPGDSSQNKFTLTEQAIYNVESRSCNPDTTTTQSVQVNLPPRQISSSMQGLFIREVRIVPLDGSSLRGYPCCDKVMTVELDNFPRDSFYEAYDVQSPVVLPYSDKENVRWDMYRLSDGIVFNYIADPYRSLKVLLSPLIAISDQSNWVLLLIGAVMLALFKFIIEPVLIDVGINRFKSLLSFIASNRGHKKVREVKQKSR